MSLRAVPRGTMTSPRGGVSGRHERQKGFGDGQAVSNHHHENVESDVQKDSTKNRTSFEEAPNYASNEFNPNTDRYPEQNVDHHYAHELENLGKIGISLGPEVPPLVQGKLQGEIEVKVTKLTVTRGALAREAKQTPIAVEFAWWGQDSASGGTVFHPYVTKTGKDRVGPVPSDGGITKVVFPVRSSAHKLGAYLRDCQTITFKVMRSDESSNAEVDSAMALGTATLELVLSEEVDPDHLLIDGTIAVLDPSTGVKVGSLEVEVRVGLGRRHSTLLAHIQANRENQRTNIAPQQTKGLSDDVDESFTNHTLNSSTFSFQMNELQASLAAEENKPVSEADRHKFAASPSASQAMPPPLTPSQKGGALAARSPPRRRLRSSSDSESLQFSEQGAAARDRALRVIKSLRGQRPPSPVAESQSTRRNAHLISFQDSFAHGTAASSPKGLGQDWLTHESRKTAFQDISYSANMERPLSPPPPPPPFPEPNRRINRTQPEPSTRTAKSLSGVKGKILGGRNKKSKSAFSAFLKQAERLRSEMDQALEYGQNPVGIIRHGKSLVEGSSQQDIVPYDQLYTSQFEEHPPYHSTDFAYGMGHGFHSLEGKNDALPIGGLAAYSAGAGIVRANGDDSDLETWIPNLLHEIGETAGFPDDPLVAAMQSVTASVAATLRSVKTIQFQLNYLEVHRRLGIRPPSTSNFQSEDYQLECSLLLPTNKGVEDTPEQLIHGLVHIPFRNKSTASQPSTSTTRRRLGGTPTNRRSTTSSNSSSHGSRINLQLSSSRPVTFDQSTLQAWLLGFLDITLKLDNGIIATGAVRLRSILLSDDMQHALQIRLLPPSGQSLSEKASFSAAASDEQALVTINVRVCMEYSKDAATIKAETRAAQAHSLALSSARATRSVKITSPPRPSKGGPQGRLRLVLDHLAETERGGLKDISVQLQHQTGRFGYVTISEGNRFVELPYDMSHISRPFILEAYDVKGNLIGLAKLPENFQIPFRDWITVRDPFSGKEMMYAYIRLESMAMPWDEDHSQSLPPFIVEDNQNSIEKNQLPLQSLQTFTSQPKNYTSLVKRGSESSSSPEKHATLTKASDEILLNLPKQMTPPENPSHHEIELLNQAQHKENQSTQTDEVNSDANQSLPASEDSSTLQQHVTATSNASPDSRSAVAHATNEALSTDKADFVETQTFQHVFVFELSSLCYRSDLAGCLVTYEFPIEDGATDEQFDALHHHELWWDSIVVENNTVGRHLIETAKVKEISHWLNQGRELRFRVVAPPIGGNDDQAREDAVAKLPLQELQSMLAEAQSVSDPHHQNNALHGDSSTFQTARAAKVFRLPLVPSRESSIALRHRAPYMKLSIRYLQYVAKQWIAVEPEFLDHPSQNFPRRVKASDAQLDEARARLCVQIAQARGLEFLARVAAKHEGDASFMHLAAAVGVNACVEVEIDVGDHHLGHRTQVQARDFSPKFNEETFIDFVLEKEVLDSLSHSSAIIRLWHQEPQTTDRKTRSILLGSTQIPLRDLLLSQSGIRGEFALESPLDILEENQQQKRPPMGYVTIAIFFDHHRDLAQYFPGGSSLFMNQVQPLPESQTQKANDKHSDNTDEIQRLAFDEDSSYDPFVEVDDNVRYHELEGLTNSPPQSSIGKTGFQEDEEEETEEIVLQAAHKTDVKSEDLPSSGRLPQSVASNYTGPFLRRDCVNENFHSEQHSTPKMNAVEPLEFSRVAPASKAAILSVSIEEAMHLPMVLVDDNLRPPLAYVSFSLHNFRFTDSRHTPPNPGGPSCSPVWVEEIKIPIEGLSQLYDWGAIRFHVWHRATWSRDKSDFNSSTSIISESCERSPPPGLDFDPYSTGRASVQQQQYGAAAVFGDQDVYLGTAVVDLSALDVGIERIHGWYHIIDTEQRRIGQLKVQISVLHPAIKIKGAQIVSQGALYESSFPSSDYHDITEDQDEGINGEPDEAPPSADCKNHDLVQALANLSLVSESLRARMLRLESDVMQSGSSTHTSEETVGGLHQPATEEIILPTDVPLAQHESVQTDGVDLMCGEATKLEQTYLMADENQHPASQNKDSVIDSHGLSAEEELQQLPSKALVNDAKENYDTKQTYTLASGQQEPYQLHQPRGENISVGDIIVATELGKGAVVSQAEASTTADLDLISKTESPNNSSLRDYAELGVRREQNTYASHEQTEYQKPEKGDSEQELVIADNVGNDTITSHIGHSHVITIDDTLNPNQGQLEDESVSQPVSAIECTEDPDSDQVATMTSSRNTSRNYNIIEEPGIPSSSIVEGSDLEKADSEIHSDSQTLSTSQVSIAASHCLQGENEFRRGMDRRDNVENNNEKPDLPSPISAPAKEPLDQETIDEENSKSESENDVIGVRSRASSTSSAKSRPTFNADPVVALLASPSTTSTDANDGEHHKIESSSGGKTLTVSSKIRTDDVCHFPMQSTFYNQLAHTSAELPPSHVCYNEIPRSRKNFQLEAPTAEVSNLEPTTPENSSSPKRLEKPWMDPETARIARILRGG